MRNIFTFIITVSSFCFGYSQNTDLTYYLPEGTEYDPKIPTPESIIGHEVGQWHISHDRLTRYMYALAEASDRVEVREYAQTHEARPLLVLTITSPQNQQKIDEIKSNHAKLTDPAVSDKLNVNEMPAVVYMGYSIHGNESSGSNAALLVAYHLAAAQSEEVIKVLDETVILLDPSFNPDGLQRFSSWVNSRKSHNIITDPNNMEQNEVWPGGRTNHYWFDLNRDWLPAQHPESRGRIALFHEWKPNVLTDHHEMGTNSTFFFQPGIPSRNNPLTPAKTYELTNRMGEYHARALDKIGSLYYTKESFDDYYYGKGSTYPDINGAVGILFEQASSRSHAQESDHGILYFPFTVKNQFTTSLSTLQAVNDMREDFLNHQRSFYKEASAEAKKNQSKAYVFGSKDKFRNYHLAELMSRHQIKLYHGSEPMSINNIRYNGDELYVIPLEQTQYRLIEAMFEKRIEFQDSLFYDISTWTLPLAFNVDYQIIDSKTLNERLLGTSFVSDQKPTGSVIGGKSGYAYAFEWYGYYTPKMLNDLLQQGYKVKVANEPFHTPDGKRFERGSILIPVQIQNSSEDKVYTDLTELARENGVDIYAFHTGLDYSGVSLGSPNFDNVKKPQVMMLVGEGVSPYDAGEVWHLFDQRYKMDISLVPIDIFNGANINKYTTIIMVSGTYREINDVAKEKLKQWLQNGGTIVASGTALTYLNSINLGKFDFVKTDDNDSNAVVKYAKITQTRGAQEIGGAIFETKIDITHPLFYGYYKEYLPVFRDNKVFLEKSKNPFANPMVYTEAPLLSGYISEPNLNYLKNSSAAGMSNYGRGQIIGFTDNLNFRAFWYGTNKIFMNAVFFGPLISNAAGR